MDDTYNFNQELIKNCLEQLSNVTFGNLTPDENQLKPSLERNSGNI